MNLVLDEAVEVTQITKTNDKETRRPLGKDERRRIQPYTYTDPLTGQILLKGDNVSLLQTVSG